MAKKKVEEKVGQVEEIVNTSEETEQPVSHETDPSTHTIARDNAVDPNSPQYVN